MNTEDRQLIALMLLEFAMQSNEVPLDQCGLGAYTVIDLAAAAHSYIQARDDNHVDEHARRIVAAIVYYRNRQFQSEHFVQ